MCYYVLIDAFPMGMAYGRPNNGMVIYEIIRYGKRVDANNEAFIPSTTDTDKYQKSIKDWMEKEK